MACESVSWLSSATGASGKSSSSGSSSSIILFTSSNSCCLFAEIRGAESGTDIKKIVTEDMYLPVSLPPWVLVLRSLEAR